MWQLLSFWDIFREVDSAIAQRQLLVGEFRSYVDRWNLHIILPSFYSISSVVGVLASIAKCTHDLMP